MKVTLTLLNTFILRDLACNKIRALLSILGIALGVAVMLAISLANNSVLGKFHESINLISGKANLSIVPAHDQSFSEEVLEQISFLHDENASINPVIEQLAVIPAKSSGSSRELVRVLGLDLLKNKEFAFASQDKNKEPGSETNAAKLPEESKQTTEQNFWEIFKPEHAYIGHMLAERQGIKAGDELLLLVGDQEKKVKIAAVLQDKGLGAAFSGDLLLMDCGCAQELFAMQGQLNRIDLILPESKRQKLELELKNKLPESLKLSPPERRGQQVEKMLRSFQYNLTALSMIALLVGVFLIYNTMSISVIRRRWEIGTLRALGLARKSIFILVAAEALILGIAGSALGVGAGVLLSGSALKAVSRTVQALYTDQPPLDIEISGQLLATAFCCGVLLALAAALAPALEAVSIAPAEAARRASYERKIERLSPSLALCGLALFALAAVAAAQEPIAGFPFFGYMSAALLVFGFAALSPFLLDKILKRAKPLLAGLLGAEAGLACASLHGALGRSAVTVATLVLGISMMVSLAVMIGSFRQTVISWAEQTLKADLWLEAAARAASNRSSGLSRDMEATIAGLPGIDAVDAFIEFPIEYEGLPCNLGAGDLEVMRSHGNLLFLSGESSSSVLARMQNRNAVIVSEPFALKHKKKVKDRLRLNSPAGPLDADIEGIYYDYASDSGYIILPRPLFEKYFHERPAGSMAIFLKPDQDPQAMRLKIQSAIPDNARLNIRTNRELKAEVLRVFDNTFSITYALHAISIAVAILSVMNSLFALTIESKRDLGILKYLGAANMQLKKLVLIEAGLLGSLGNLGGLALGLVLSYLLIEVINKQSFGWTVRFALPGEFLLESFLLVFVCSLIAGLLPAAIAAKTHAPEVLRAE